MAVEEVVSSPNQNMDNHQLFSDDGKQKSPIPNSRVDSKNSLAKPSVDESGKNEEIGDQISLKSQNVSSINVSEWNSKRSMTNSGPCSSRISLESNICHCGSVQTCKNHFCPKSIHSSLSFVAGPSNPCKIGPMCSKCIDAFFNRYEAYVTITDCECKYKK